MLHRAAVGFLMATNVLPAISRALAPPYGFLHGVASLTDDGPPLEPPGAASLTWLTLLWRDLLDTASPPLPSPPQHDLPSPAARPVRLPLIGEAPWRSRSSLARLPDGSTLPFFVCP